MIFQAAVATGALPRPHRWIERLVDAPDLRTRRVLRAAALSFPLVVTAWSTWYDALAAREAPDAGQLLAFLAGGLSLYLVRRLPVVPSVVAPLVWAATGSCSFVMVMAVVLGARRPRGWLLVLGAYTVLHPLGLVPVPCSFRAGHVALPEETAPLLGVVLPALVGGAVGEASRLVALREDRLRLAAEVAAARAADVVAHERLRLSRDMHDLVGQNVSRMTLHASAIAARSADAEARSLATRIADTGADLLEDVHFVVGLLRDGADGADRATGADAADGAHVASSSGPDIGTGPRARSSRSWQESIDAAERDGTVVRRHGPAAGPIARTAGLDDASSAVLDAVLAEALHNATKHAPGAAVDVRGEIWPDLVRVLVENPVTDHAPALPSGGHGLAVAAERAASVGGRVTHGVVGERFRVTVEVPR
ncbi:histidine kinase [Curtobacterium sp. RHCKG23]|uniref:histidine kinase n=1 Tax=Curtobacterium citri TaxID=3055139 RepID=A0ABT7T3D8_9MICO|nr:histidine kinase [Curtobacterium citri]MDM7884093.1 histidine kinase [Curtobacterium citri]